MNEQGDFLDIRYDRVHKIWKSVNCPYGDVTNRTVGEAFLKSMRSLDPNKVLEYHYDVGKEKRVKDIYEESIAVATNLQRLGVGRGDVVVLFSGYNYMTSVLTFGSLLIGSVVNFFEVQLENEDIDSIMDILQPTMILYECSFEEKVVTFLERGRPKSLKYVYVIDVAGDGSAESNLLRRLSKVDYGEFDSIALETPQREVAFLVLTSGSTGVPKVIQLSHSAVLHGMYIWWSNPFNYEPPSSSNSILFSLSPLRWISQIELLLQSAILGIKRICANKTASGSYGLKILQETSPTHLFSVPSFFHEVLLELQEADRESLKSLKYVQLGGEYPSKTIMEMTKWHAKNSRLFYSYGMSEVSGSITNDEFISGGKLQPGYEAQILDEDFSPLGPNEHGRIALKTPHPFVGYKGLDNTKYFLRNSFFLNGDYGYFDEENTLHLLARYSDLIRSPGAVLIPNTVESLASAVPGVQMARLVGCGKAAPQADEVGCLFVILKANASAPPLHMPQEISTVLRRKLSANEFALIRHIRIVEEFPLTTCGKIDRIALKKWAASS